MKMLLINLVYHDTLINNFKALSAALGQDKLNKLTLVGFSVTIPRVLIFSHAIMCISLKDDYQRAQEKTTWICSKSYLLF